MRGEDEEICVSLCLDTKDIGRSEVQGLVYEEKRWNEEEGKFERRVFIFK